MPEDGIKRSFTRRGFMQGVGAAAALAGCKQLPVQYALPYPKAPVELTPGIANWYASACSGCPAACGLLMKVRDGRPIKLEGLPAHPLSRGGLCALGQAEVRGLYDPNRLRGPSLAGAAASWEAVDQAVTAGLDRVRAAGREVWALTPTLTSPTARATLHAFLARHGEAPAARHIEIDPDPASPTAALEAARLLHGRPLEPALDLGSVNFLLSLAADPLGAGADPVGFTHAYAARRRAARSLGLLKHTQVESSFSLTGAAADVRWLMTPAERERLALEVLREVAARSTHADAGWVREAVAGGAPSPRAQGLADELLAQRGHALMLTGSDRLAEQVAVGLTNRLLGAEGQALDVERPSLRRRGLPSAWQSLLQAMDAGRVGALFIVGSDPVEMLPEGEHLAERLRGLPLAVAITDRPTATAAACGVVAAAHHGLECWGDAMPRPGVVSLVQPGLRPLFDTRHPYGAFLHWQPSPATTDYRLHLAASWRGAGPDAQFQTWVAAGQVGDPDRPVAQAALPERTVADDAAQRLRAALAEAWAHVPAAPVLQVELSSEVALRDGSRAFNPWLRELPDPLTRGSWLGVARVAKELGFEDGEVLRIEAGGRAVEMPARVLPGQHPSVVTLPVGYGRQDSPEGASVANAYRLGVRQGEPVTVTRTGRRETLPLVQVATSLEGRPHAPIVRSFDSPALPGEHVAHSLWGERDDDDLRWQMVIDLDACTGCGACVVGCQAENNIPVVGPQGITDHRDMHWIRIDRYFEGGSEAAPGANPEGSQTSRGVDARFEPMLCAQCGHAPCETVCPVLATVHSHDGLNQQVYNRCVGTRYCANNCPYKVRRFNWFEYATQDPLERMVLNPDVTVRMVGVMEKCTFCVQRIQASRIAARKGEAADPPQTACQQSCPAKAIAFGNGNDPSSAVAALRREPRAFQVLAELGIEPSITYLARVRQGEGG